jgi:hypothetical protein
MNGTFFPHHLPFPDEQKTIYFAVFFPSLRDGDKSNHFGELKTTTLSRFVRDLRPVALANEHPDESAILFTPSATLELHVYIPVLSILNHPYIYFHLSLLKMVLVVLRVMASQDNL